MAASRLSFFTLFAIVMGAGTVCCLAQDAQNVEVPKGIVYKTVDQKTDDAARKAVAEAFAGGGPKVLALCKDFIMCGPGYWEAIRQDPAIKAVHTVPSVINVPNTSTGEVKKFEGAMFKEDDARKAFAERIAADVGPSPKIRKLTADELKIFWAMIPFDIQEPVYILESGDQHYLVNLTDDKGVLSFMWVDEISHFSFSGEKKFQLTNVVLYQDNDILLKRGPSATDLVAYIKQLEAVAENFFDSSYKEETFHIVVALRPGGHSRFWFISSKRAGNAKELAPLRKKLEAVTPPEVKDGPVAFALSSQIRGGDSASATDNKDFKPPIPKEWSDAVKKKKGDLTPDDYIDAAWPAPKTTPQPTATP